MESSSDEVFGKQIITYIKTLEERIANLEARAGIDFHQDENNFKLPPIFTHKTNEETDALEDEIGQFWFAKAGIVILVVGLVLILALQFAGLPPILPSVIGFVTATALVLVSHYLRNAFELLSKYLFGAGLLITYFASLRLHYFTPEPAIENTTLAVIILYISAFIHIFASYRRKSVNLLSFSVLLVLLSALLSGDRIIFQLTLFSLALFVLYLKLKYHYIALFNFSVILIFIALIWYSAGNHLFSLNQNLNNPVVADAFSLFIYVIIFSLGTYLVESYKEDFVVIASSSLNTIIPFLLLLVISALNYKEYMVVLHLSASVVFLSIAILYFIKYNSRYLTFLYALTSYIALSVAIIGNFARPEFFVWLSWQSFLVVSTAIWFRSKIIIVTNFIIYLIVYLAYLILAEKFGVISLSFGFVALLSARVMNWQKHRLELKTEIMRNAYLAAAFFIFPFALYHIVPMNYVSIAWMIVAVFYFILGLVFKIKKYRWMALLTLLLTGLYLLTFGSSGSDTALKIISFIILGIVLIATSFFYAKRKKKMV